MTIWKASSRVFKDSNNADDSELSRRIFLNSQETVKQMLKRLTSETLESTSLEILKQKLPFPWFHDVFVGGISQILPCLAPWVTVLEATSQQAGRRGKCPLVPFWMDGEHWVRNDGKAGNISNFGFHLWLGQFTAGTGFSLCGHRHVLVQHAGIYSASQIIACHRWAGKALWSKGEIFCLSSLGLWTLPFHARHCWLLQWFTRP